MPKTIEPAMSKEKARACCDRELARTRNARRAKYELRKVIAELREGKGWISLGYPTWESLCDAEFGGLFKGEAYAI